jgi:UDP:flavonoid glycosyltransferase YjiC (YdhE family)
MSRVLILSWDGGGNTPSAFHLGSRLVRRGHRVRMIGWDTMAVRAAASGLEFTTYPSVPPWPADVRQDDDWPRVEAALFGAATAADVVDEARSFGADLLVVDCMLTAGYAAAEVLGLPVVSLVHVRYPPFVQSWGSAVLKTDVPAMLASSRSVLALQPPGFDPPELMQGATPVGAVLRPGPEERLEPWLRARLAEPGSPWVLLSLSTTLQGQVEALPRLLAALGSLPIRVLLTLGGVLPTGAVPVPPNVTTCGFVPHSTVLPHMAAFVTHAGMSSVTTALAAGVPLVCVPQGRDQPLNAEQIEEVGAGVLVAPDAPPELLAGAVRTVLTEPRFRIAAERLAATAATVGNGELATDLVAGAAFPPERASRRVA